VHQYGIQGRTEATGRGVFYGIREAMTYKEDMEEIGLTQGIEGKTMAVQGLGNVGYYTASISQKEGGVKVVCVAEYEGAIYNKDGIDIEKLMKFRKKTGSIIGFPGSTKMKSRKDVLTVDCDILVPAALENQITMANVKKVKAKLIAEAANGPVTADASEYLLKKGKMIIPDMYINAGGVTVSYFEWLKNLSHMRFGRMEKRFDQSKYGNMVNLVERLTGKTIGIKERSLLTSGADEIDLVRSGLEETMITAYGEIRSIKKRKKKITDLRTAAFVSAIKKISSDYLSLGIWP